MKKIFLLIFLTLTFYSFSQGEAANWYFGNGAGLNFDITSGTVTATDEALGTINTSEGCSSISDVNGNLLFYTDGRNVWDRNFQIMPNANYNTGLGLHGDPSSTSSGLIVPKPGNPNQYYIFTVDEPHHNNAWAYPNQGPADENGNALSQYQETAGEPGTIPENDDGFNNGLNYSLVDMTLNGGFGDVVDTEKNIHLVTYDENDQTQSSFKCSEKITAVAHADGNSYWVITHFINTFYAFRIDASGVNTTPTTTSIGPLITTEGYRRNAIGYLKSSPDGDKLVICHTQNINTPSNSTSSNNTGSVWLYDFNNETGQISNPENLISNVQTYGVEFSADSQKIYASVVNGDVQIIQFDLNNNFQNTIVHSQQINSFIAALQLAPNGKIYICNTASENALDVIENPEESGAACNYNLGGQPLAAGTQKILGLPPFIQSFLLANINADKLCFGEATQFSIESSETILNILWDFGDGTSSNLESPTHTYSSLGNYTVIVTVTTADETKTFTRGISISETPTAFPAEDILICDEGTNDGIANFDLSSNSALVLDNQNADDFSIHYFISQEDADNFENEIATSFQNTINPQEIFARIQNISNTECYDTTSFNIQTFSVPVANSVNDIIECDDDIDGDSTNGQKITDLSLINPIILGNQDENLFTISYHSSEDDANNNENTLPLNYYNQTPFNETIFARIENNSLTDCFSITAINIIINPIPQSFNASLLQCDEDGIPDGFTTFNLTQANNELTGNTNDVVVNFFTSLNDAENSTNEIDGNSLNNWNNPQIIYAQVLDETTGCFSIAELSLEVSTTSVEDFTPTPLCDELDSEDGFNTFNLSSIAQEFQNFNALNLPVSFYETYQDALLETNGIFGSYNNTTAYNQTIFARVENENACYGIAEIYLTVNTLPQLEDDEEYLYCLNNYPQETITLSAGILNDSIDNYYYQWFFNNTTLDQDDHDIIVNEVGTYKVIVTTTKGCTKERNFTIEASNIATIETINVTDVSQNNTITVLVSGEGNYQYALDDENGIYQDSNIFTNIAPGFHTVYVRDIKNNCGIVSDIVSIIGFPKFFTPNGDDYNPTWHVIGVSEQFQPNSKILIFNRHGKLITELSPLGNGWDGTYNGKPMPADDYWFFVTLQDGRVFKNHFTLKR